MPATTVSIEVSVAAVAVLRVSIRESANRVFFRYDGSPSEAIRGWL